MEIKHTSKLTTINLNKLHLRYVPHVEPLKLYNDDLRLKNSPHVEMLYLIATHGFDWEKLKKSRYVQILRHKHIMGIGGYNTGEILDTLNKAWRTYIKISRKGIKGKRCVIVLEEPFWVTRFNYKKKNIKGMEIWSGVWVCAAASFLGIKEIKGRMAKDAYPGSKIKGVFEEMYKGIDGVWSE